MAAGGLGEVLLHDLEPSLPRRYFSNVVDAVCTSVSAAVREVVSSRKFICKIFQDYDVLL
jgi:hypothetical protein